MKGCLPRIAMLIVALCSSCTERPVQFETVVEDCQHYCHVVVFVCEYEVEDPQDYKERCTNECVGRKDDALQDSAGCAQSYEDMMVCVGAMVNTCEDWYDWALRSTNGACLSESLAYDQGCKEQ